jgi:hypothetical protein
VKFWHWVALAAGGYFLWTQMSSSSSSSSTSSSISKFRRERVANATFETWDVMALPGAYGPHAEMFVLRYSVDPNNGRVWAVRVDRAVPEGIITAAAQAYGVTIPVGV